MLILAFTAGLVLIASTRNIDLAGNRERRLSAEYLARSGLDCAAYEINCGDWLERSLPFELTWKVDKGNIRVKVSDAGPRLLCIQCTGVDRTGIRCKMRMLIGKPDVFTKYVLSVVNYDSSVSKLEPGSFTEIGSANMAASSIREELGVVPEGGVIRTHGMDDSYYSGIVPGTTYVMDDAGRELIFDVGTPTGEGHYSVDMKSGAFVFHKDDKGKIVCIFYDYFRRVPVAPRPLQIWLENSPLRLGGERVWGVNGSSFWKSDVAPVVQANYYIDPNRGMVQFSSFDSGSLVRIAYSHLGSRFTGPVAINGDLKWNHINRCFLLESRGDRFRISGKFSYELGAKVSVCTEKAEVKDVQLDDSAKNVFQEKQPAIEPPVFNLDWLRRQANPDMGGSGLYIDNPSEVECIEVDPGRGTRPLSEKELLAEWRARGSRRWQAGTYVPPGKTIDLSKLSTQPENGLIFAEGNLIVSGKLPPGRRLTLVSGNNIYIQGNIWRKGQGASLALLADNNVCINLTKMEGLSSNQHEVPPCYINGLVYARRGTLAVIPHSTREFAATIFGAVCINKPLDNEDFGRAFSAIDFVYDPTLGNTRNRPPYLSSVVRMEGDR